MREWFSDLPVLLQALLLGVLYVVVVIGTAVTCYNVFG